MSGSSQRQAQTDRIKSLALAAGFPLVGIATIDSGTQAGARLTEWLERGFAGSMAYLYRHTELRRNPQLVLPGARSLIALAVPYKSIDQPAEVPAGTGRVSNYAWGDDYHRVLRARLDSLLESLFNAFPGSAARGFVDTGPILEREWAARAGLGWIGKHTLLINKQLGSYVFLAEILTDLDLVPDATGTNHCGTCTACLDACPTAAFPEPGVLDASKCISYLTIEHRGDIPGEFHPALGEWIYGCDICQMVCPWNRKAPATLDPAFQPRHHWIAPSLADVATMSESTYVEWTRHSAMKRAKREGLRRNAQLVFRHQTRG